MSEVTEQRNKGVDGPRHGQVKHGLDAAPSEHHHREGRPKSVRKLVEPVMGLRFNVGEYKHHHETADVANNNRYDIELWQHLHVTHALKVQLS
jgi:hypothetical protein